MCGSEQSSQKEALPSSMVPTCITEKMPQAFLWCSSPHRTFLGDGRMTVEADFLKQLCFWNDFPPLCCQSCMGQHFLQNATYLSQLVLFPSPPSSLMRFLGSFKSMPVIYPKESASCSNLIAVVVVIKASLVSTSFVSILCRVISEFVEQDAKCNLRALLRKRIPN